MSNYVNLTDSQVEAFWKLPALPQLLQLIRDNNLTQRIAWKARSGTTNTPTLYTDLSDRTGKKIRSLTNELLNYLADKIDSATLEERLRTTLCRSEVVSDPFMREPIAITNDFLDSKQMDIANAFNTWIRLKDIHDAKCVSQQGPSQPDLLAHFSNDLKPTAPRSFAGHLYKADQRMRHGDYRGALINLEQVVKITGMEVNLIEQCICYFQLGELSMARRLFERWLAEPHCEPTSSAFERWEKLPPAKP